MKKIIALLTGLTIFTQSSGSAPVQLASSLQQMDHQIETMADEIIDTVAAMKNLEYELSNYMLLEGLDEQTWSVCVQLPKTGQIFSLGNQEGQTAASSIKLYVAGAVLEAWDELAEIYDPAVMEHMVESSMTISDNAAATSLVVMLGHGDMHAGKERVNDYCARNGLDASYVGIIFEGLDPTGTYNSTSSEDCANYLSMLYNNEVPSGLQLLEYLKGSQRLGKIPAVLPAGTQVANKTGELDYTQNDVCLVYGPKRDYILSVMADEVLTEPAIIHIQNMSAIVWNVLEEDAESLTE